MLAVDAHDFRAAPARALNNPHELLHKATLQPGQALIKKNHPGLASDLYLLAFSPCAFLYGTQVDLTVEKART
jgi:hypothetical protein